VQIELYPRKDEIEKNNAWSFAKTGLNYFKAIIIHNLFSSKAPEA